jgi:hypothetical protein
LGLVLAVAATSATARAQVLQDNTSQIPAGTPFNDSFSENVDFADIDLDGDYDAVFADGGDCCSDQNRLWVNMGGLQGGTIGFFQDRTSTQFPAVLDDGRDVDFVDIDRDGDPDLYLSATSAISNQSNRFWINQGGLQGGSAGFFTDETSTRWIGIASGSSSVAASLAFPSGGFVDWSCDCSFADLDNDGDMDLVHTTYGGVFGGGAPSRLFLNDGSGFFQEFNPSAYQLSGTQIPNGAPALWCEGVQQHGTTNSTGQQADIADTPLGVELGDVDGDHDIDILQGARDETPRLYVNRFEEAGGTLVPFRDVTFGVMAQTATGGGHYEQEFADFDEDGDLDIYGLNWTSPQLSDITTRNDGSGRFGPFTVLANSSNDDNEGDFVDYDNDGHLDLFVSAFFSGDRMYHNSGPPNFDLTPATGVVPSYFTTSLGADACDVDLDGDYDIMVSSDGGDRNVLLKNTSNVADTTAPRLVNLEQAPDRQAGSQPTIVRVRVLDNTPWYLTAFNATQLNYSVNGGAFSSAPMDYTGGWSFRGEIPGNLVGNVCYFVESRDEYNNLGSSPVLCFASMGGCASNPSTFCTAKAGLACGTPSISSTGTASASASSGFVISASPARGNRLGVLLYNTALAPAPLPFNGGLLCVQPMGLRRGGPTNSLGTSGACDGVFSIDMNTFAQGLWVVPPTGAIPPNNPAGFLTTAGTSVHCQFWGRDSIQTGSYVSEGLSFSVCP